MKTTYHITIDRSECENFESILEHLNAEIEAKITMNTATANTIEYLVQLSKYDLLLVRLAVKAGKVIEVPENV